MSMNKMLAVAAVASMMATSAFAANPFSDVPMNHWAYDAVAQLSAKGVLEGYPNGTFKGNKAMTRYEIATMVARMMANGGIGGADLEKLKALVVEFQPELEALGVKVDGFDSRISALEKGVGGWKITGQIRLDYYGWDKEMADLSSNEGSNGFSMNRARLFLHKDLANGISVDTRWHGGKFDRFWLTMKDAFGMKGLTMKAGEFTIAWEGDDGLYYDNDQFFMDTNYRGFDAQYKKGGFLLEGFAASNKGAKQLDGSKNGVYNDNVSGDYYGARLKYTFNDKAWVSANAFTEKKDGTDYKVYWFGLGIKPVKGLEVKGAYYMEKLGEESVSIKDVDDPKAYKIILDVKQDLLKFTSLWAEYNKFDQGFIIHNTPWIFHPNMAVANLTAPEDTKLIAFGAKQKWSDKWSTFERFAKYKVDHVGDAKEWTVGVGYQYSPALSFELAYNKMDVDVSGLLKGLSDDDHYIRFRTFLNF